MTLLQREMVSRRKQDINAILVTDTVCEWESLINSMEGVKKIPPNQAVYLYNLLRNETDVDSYLTSLNYYFFTGRKGLWVYEKNGSFIPFCWHPNIEGKILVFPQRGNTVFSILDGFLEMMPLPPAGISLAREKGNVEAPSRLFKLKKQSSFLFCPVIEKILDWTYPVHILDTKRVAEMDGPSFRYTRNHVKRMENVGGITKNIKELHPLEIDSFIVKWAESSARFSTEEKELIELYRKLVSFHKNPSMCINGFVVIINGKVEAITMWDLSNQQNTTANRFVNLCNTSYRGLADFVTVSLSKMLAQQGVEYLNIGGAETHSLNAFKKKFMPVISIPMHSVEALKPNATLISETAHLKERSYA